MIQNDENSNQEETWGWGPYGSEEDACDTSNAVPVDGTPSRDHTRTNSSAELRKSSSEKSFTSKRQLSNHVLKGIASSPSFQELEKAIGVALSQSSTDENGETKTLSPNASFTTSKLSSTNLMQQKVMQHRVRQQHIAGGYQNPRINHSSQKPSSGFISQPAKSELSPFINESESRALVLFHSPSIPQILVRDVCSKFGVLYYIRPEFHSKGVTFLSYFDLQSSLSAKESLPSTLGSAAEASVHFSIMLHATTSNTEEFRLIVKSLPDTVTEGEIQNICSRYGPLRSIQKTFGSATDLSYSDARHISLSYSVEYFNIQDARLAASELSATSSNIWGPEALVRFAPLDERKKQLCKQLLGVLSRWRSELAQPSAALPFLVPQTPMTMVPQINSAAMSIPHGLHYSQLTVPQTYSSPPFAASLEYGIMPVQSPFFAPPLNPSLFHNLYNSPFASTYSGVFVDQGSPRLLVPSPPFGMEVNNHFQLSQLQDNGHFFLSGVPVQDYVDTNCPDLESDYNSSVVPRDDPSIANTSRHGPQQGSRHKQHRESSDVDFSLDTSRLLDGSEKRTTIMVRNIPNKYTQQMLLEEVNQKFLGTYDFFYLPIDFKNRCNVGYCFINFLGPQYIPAFVEEFHGQKWKSFNSEKVCAVSFARIQGKQAMIARFQNSSLMDKVDEYKPLLFYSTGINMGKPEPFPNVVNKPIPSDENDDGDNPQQAST